MSHGPAAAVRRTVAGLTLVTLLAACGADDREMHRPSPDQTTTTLVRGTTTTLFEQTTVPPTSAPETLPPTSTTLPPTSAG